MIPKAFLCSISVSPAYSTFPTWGREDGVMPVFLQTARCRRPRFVQHPKSSFLTAEAGKQSLRRLYFLAFQLVVPVFGQARRLPSGTRTHQLHYHAARQKTRLMQTPNGLCQTGLHFQWAVLWPRLTLNRGVMCAEGDAEIPRLYCRVFFPKSMLMSPCGWPLQPDQVC